MVSTMFQPRSATFVIPHRIPAASVASVNMGFAATGLLGSHDGPRTRRARPQDGTGDGQSDDAPPSPQSGPPLLGSTSGAPVFSLRLLSSSANVARSRAASSLRPALV